KRLNPISNEIPFSKWRKPGWQRLYMQTVSHAVAGATLAEHVPMHPDRPTGQKIGRNSDVRRRLLPAEHAAAEGLRRPGSEPNRRASKGSADSDTYEYPLGLAGMTFLP